MSFLDLKRTFCAVFALVIFIPLTAMAQDAAQAPPPQSQAGKDYIESVFGKGLQTSVVYLRPDADLDEKPVEEQNPAEFSDTGTLTFVSRGILGVFLVLCVGALIYWRRSIIGLFERRDREFGETFKERGKQPVAAPVDLDLVSRLESLQDPREGLRIILQRFLDLAARDNAINSKRSLTTRELMQRLPGSWQHREALEQVARQTELVVFGGRHISREAYEECLRLVKPFLHRVGPA
ncbi:DUF4129 domain-containing protein [Oryzifoliimicrobium ureilyticus]|uniref:DUF4129 domain-containing protein n=1 Tax=Oryzifoliimicrobium ureilyticus TaxID=3113724 RepID=UPI0030760D3B